MTWCQNIYSINFHTARLSGEEWCGSTWMETLLGKSTHCPWQTCLQFAQTSYIHLEMTILRIIRLQALSCKNGSSHFMPFLIISLLRKREISMWQTQWSLASCKYLEQGDGMGSRPATQLCPWLKIEPQTLLCVADTLTTDPHWPGLFKELVSQVQRLEGNQILQTFFSLFYKHSDLEICFNLSFYYNMS